MGRWDLRGFFCQKRTFENYFFSFEGNYLICHHNLGFSGSKYMYVIFLANCFIGNVLANG